MSTTCAARLSAFFLTVTVLSGCAGDGPEATTELLSKGETGSLANLDLKVDVADAKGTIYVALFSDKEGYDEDASSASGAAEVKGEQVAFTFKDLQPGRYAVKAFQDMNGDGELNTSAIGIPTEPFAFSNNAPAGFGPPSFEKAAFQLEAGTTLHVMAIK